ncbi:MAG: ACP synthase, partial [Myxococcaceae bacterium]
VKRHAGECAACRAKLRGIEEEQAKFEQTISLERFRAGVERAARGNSGAPRSPTGIFVMAAAAAVALFVVPIAAIKASGPYSTGGNGIKGGTAVELHIAGANNGPQRVGAKSVPELLAPGERVRIEYEPGDHRYLAAVSVDEQGEVTPLYPENGPALKVEPSTHKGYLPDSIEFTGKGAETVVVLFTDAPIDMKDVVSAAKDAYERGEKDVQKLPDLYLPGEQVHRTVIKP